MCYIIVPVTSGKDFRSSSLQKFRADTVTIPLQILESSHFTIK